MKLSTAWAHSNRRSKSDPPLAKPLNGCAFAALRSCHDAGPPLVPWPVAIAGDLHDRSVMEDAVEHGVGPRRRQTLGPSGRTSGLTWGSGAFLVALGHDLEEQIGLVASKWPISSMMRSFGSATVRYMPSRRRPRRCAVSSVSTRSAALKNLTFHAPWVARVKTH
jgi:hypothetical protein